MLDTNFFKWLENFNIHIELPIHLLIVNNINIKKEIKNILLKDLKKQKEFHNFYNNLSNEEKLQLLSYIHIKYKFYIKYKNKKNFIDILNYLSNMNRYKNKEKEINVYNMYTKKIFKVIENEV